tara:strand:- start:374 stop:649 length:276 start_codon:yes stop_codon:yes gene_type:complete
MKKEKELQKILSKLNDIERQNTVLEESVKELTRFFVLGGKGKLLTIEQAADYVGVSISTFYKLRSQKKIPKFDRYKPEILDEFFVTKRRKN